MFTPWERFLMIYRYGEVKKNVHINTLNRLYLYYESLSNVDQAKINDKFDIWYTNQCAIGNR